VTGDVRIEVALIGAGPIGLEVAYELKRAGIDYLHIDKSQIGSTIAWFPEQMTFFSSTDRIALAGVPIQTPGQRKCTKEEYLAYLRSFAQAFDLDVRTYEEVTSLEPGPDGFLLRTRSAAGEHEISAAKVILATGDMDRARRLGVPGEDLPHVDHYFRDPHPYFRRQLLVVGGRNSAAEAALRCWHAGAEVAISYRRGAFDERSVKYWLLPELVGRIRRREIGCHYETEPVAITPTHVTLRRGEETFEVPADFVLLLVGYEADTKLLEMAGVELAGAERAPVHDRKTMETNVPGVFVAGTATAGSQQRYSVFIENCHVHAQRIVAALTDAPPPPEPPPLTEPES
jgi:thioredoxin reductase (NADPH)